MREAWHHTNFQQWEGEEESISFLLPGAGAFSTATHWVADANENRTKTSPGDDTEICLCRAFSVADPLIIHMWRM